MPIDYLAEARITYLKWLATENADEEAKVRLYRDYASGQQPVYLNDRQKEFIGLRAVDTARLYSHNLCKLVVDAVIERLAIKEFVTDGGTSEKDALETLVEGWWRENRGEILQDQVHEAACRDDESYLIVSWDAENRRPQWTLNLKSDGTQGVKLFRDPSTDEVKFAVKRWQIVDPLDKEKNGRTRQTLYFPDRVEKYISGKGSNQGIGGLQWDPITDRDGEPWPIPWVDGEGKSLGMAVIPFTNPGGSEIEDLMPIQDLLNKSDLDLIAAADSSGFRILWAAGMPADIDATTGKERVVNISPAHMVRFSDPAAKLDAIDPADLERLISTCKYWIESGAGVTRTPQYLFQAQGADQPSGESLREQEVGLIKKVVRRQRVFGAAWLKAIELSVKLHNLYLVGESVEWTPLNADWENAAELDDPLETDEREATIVKTLVDAGMPLVTALKQVGWSDEQIDEMLAEQKREQQERKQMLASAVLRAQQELDQGEADDGLTHPSGALQPSGAS